MKRTTHPARLSLLALAAGGILVTVGHALSTPIEGTGQEYVARFTANRPEHVAGLLLTTIGALLFLPGVGGVLRVLDGRSRLARVGGTLGAIGAAALAIGDGVVTFTMGALTGKDVGLAASVYDAMDDSSLMSLPFQFAPLFVLGFVLLGIALIRLRGPLRWSGIALILGSLLVPVSESGGLAAAATLTPLAIGCAAIAAALWRQPQRGSGTTRTVASIAAEAA